MELKLMSAFLFLYAFKVLIVPYGIETLVHEATIICRKGVNCTLWN